MLWLRERSDFIATTKQGRYVVYHAGGRLYATSFRPSGMRALTRDLGVGGSIGEAKSIAERHALRALGHAAYASRATVTRLPSNFRLQSLLLPHGKFTPSTAVAWAARHGWRHDKIDVPANGRYLRLRQFAPGEAIKGTFRIVPFGKGIKAVFARVPRQLAARLDAERRSRLGHSTRVRRAA